MLTYGNSFEKPLLKEFKNCVGKLIHYQKNIGKFEARNPFNRGMYYHGFIFQLNKEALHTCIKK